MSKVKIRVRKELVSCKNCGNANSFYYLCDFSYGKRLIPFSNSSQYAFIDLIGDKTFLEYEELAEKIILEVFGSVDKNILNSFINKTYGITFDLIEDYAIDFSIPQKKCLICGSEKFENKLLEPESIVEIEVWEVSHKNWNNLSLKEKEELIRRALI